MSLTQIFLITVQNYF